eukprot:scaffold48_cov311-Pinguiococcus_pyrenoidosus.AAC.72
MKEEVLEGEVRAGSFESRVVIQNWTWVIFPPLKTRDSRLAACSLQLTLRVLRRSTLPSTASILRAST